MEMEDSGIEQQKSRMNVFFLKWVFLSQLRKLKKLDATSCAHADVCAIERQFFARQMNKLGDLNKLTLDQLKNDLKEARSEINELST